MSDLSPKAAALIRAGRTAMRPSAADRERTTEALRARLGAAALPLELGISGSLFARSAWAKIAALGAAVGIAGSAVFLALHEPAATPARDPAPQVLVSPSPEAPPVAPVATHVIAESAAVALPASGVSVASARRPTDRLAEEVAILARATSELHAGRAANALRAIDEHQRKFPRGVLAQERRAARVQALCALGRRGEAQPELDRLARIAPQSPNTLRAQQVCGSASR